MLHWPQISRLHRHHRPAIITLVVILVVVFVLVSFVWRRAMTARAFAEGMQCEGNQCAIEIALFMYNNRNGHMPPAHVDAPDGTRMHSWRTLIREETENFNFPYNFYEPWNGPNNSKYGDRGIGCPSDPDTQINRRLTNYFIIEGSKTLFPGTHATSIINEKNKTKFGNTILFAEARGLDIEWLEPRDLDYNTMSFRINDPNRPSISSPHPQGAIVRMADGSVQFLNERIAPDVLKAMLEVP
jgi:hypothetical protein